MRRLDPCADKVFLILFASTVLGPAVPFREFSGPTHDSV